jgi:hypothetical protein
MVAPTLVLLAPLLRGHYLGAGTLDRVRTARRGAPRRRHRSAPMPQRCNSRAPLVSRGGLLLAASLAARPPC